MTLTFHVLWMLCTLGAAVFAAVPEVGRRVWWHGAAVMGLPFAVSAAGMSPERLPDHAWVGLASASVSAALLVRCVHEVVALVLAGVLAGAWSALLEAQGLPMPVAVAAAAMVPAASYWLRARRSGFVTPVLRDDALMGVLIGGALVATLPGVLDGWRAAASLSVPAADLARPAAIVPAWTLYLSGAALVGGACYSLWSRR